MTTKSEKNISKVSVKKKIQFKDIIPYIYIAPMVILLLVFSGYPFVQGIWQSFFIDDGVNYREFVETVDQAIKRGQDLIFSEVADVWVFRKVR